MSEASSSPGVQKPDLSMRHRYQRLFDPRRPRPESHQPEHLTGTHLSHLLGDLSMQPHASLHRFLSLEPQKEVEEDDLILNKNVIEVNNSLIYSIHYF